MVVVDVGEDNGVDVVGREVASLEGGCYVGIAGDGLTALHMSLEGGWVQRKVAAETEVEDNACRFAVGIDMLDKEAEGWHCGFGLWVGGDDEEPFRDREMPSIKGMNGDA